ncbi:MAG: hypothetical protein PSW75_01415 [bacterium]|nr:hypothetical protein [bacterium]MDI1337357.1 hypothetical protein [Lacunisphaera sp.]
MRWPIISFWLLAAATLARAAVPALLGQAVDKWIGERDQWAFTQFVREFDGGAIKEERLERYDPSQPGERRWQLLSVNGRLPAAGRRAEWQQRKMKKRLNPGKPLGGFFDFEHATVADETAQVVRYHLPLRNDHSWLFPMDRVNLKVTVNRTTHAIDQIEAGIDEPFRVALGLGRVLDLDFDVQMNPSTRRGETDNPNAAKPSGTATAAMNKLGERVEYAWSKFQRVTPHPDNALTAAPKG